MSGSLILEDGKIFSGLSFGEQKSIVGEVVFNTGMVGYPESLTDPSYCGQILVFTYPLIGNYGAPDFLLESKKIQVTGVIVSDYSSYYSHWSARNSLGGWLKNQDIPALSGIDTRMLAKTLRQSGTLLGKITFGPVRKSYFDFGPTKKYFLNKNFVSKVSLSKLKSYQPSHYKKTVILIDCGAKESLVISLLNRNCRVVRVPWNFNFKNADFSYDGVLISNGPGDPRVCGETINQIRWLMSRNKPILGICLGHQLLSLAAGVKTYKLKYGHRSQNQPCIDSRTGRCYVTSQNHGYAIQESTLPRNWKIWFSNANDGTNEGIYHQSKPFLAVQFHPEARPGPLDTGFIFDEFLALL